MYMSSQCTNDGNYTLTVTFKPGTDLNIAQVLVQNRESLAEPILPDLVKRRGVSVKKKSPNVLMIVNLFSPDDSRDEPRPEQLRDDPDSRRAARACPASATSPISASAITACGSGSIPQKMAFSQPDRQRRDHRGHAAERPGRGRADRPAAGAARPGVSVHDHDAWAG